MELFKIGFVPVRLIDMIDISIVTFIFYKIYDVLRGSLAWRGLGALIAIFFIWKLVDILDFVLLKSILDEFLGLGALALVIIFAPEIRRFLTLFGKNSLFDRLLRPAYARVGFANVSTEIIRALKDLRASGSGALIVFLGKDPLREIRETGDNINADISSRLIVSIFQKNSPLHDGAMVLSNNKILAVRSILPISKKPSISADLGMRHRAGIGVSENSDALVIIVSEERRELSLAQRGSLKRNVDYQDVEEAIQNHLSQIMSGSLQIHAT
ncbi:MAG: diadenylate cyclase CdaA [Bacteroidota bacterium]